MKVAVYGDSFAQRFWDYRFSPGESWVDILAKKHEVTNFSASGSSVWFSYLKFIDNHYKFDRNIFLVSNDERIYLHELENKVTIPDHVHFQVHQLEYITTEYGGRLSSNTNREAILDIWTAATNFRRRVNTSKEDEFKNFLLIEFLKNKHSNTTIFINCFNGNNHFKKDANFLSLLDISNIENDALGALENLYTQVNIIDIRHCHLTNENNSILADKLDHWIMTNEFNLRITDFRIPKIEEKEIYFKHVRTR